MNLENFYKTKNVKSYIDGRIDWCKECLKNYRSERREHKKQTKEIIDSGFFIEKRELILTFD